MFDIKAVEAQARKELAEARAKEATTKIKSKLEQIAKAEKIVQTLRMEYEVLLKEIALEV